MTLKRLVSAVNGARAREDYEFYYDSGYQSGNLASEFFTFSFGNKRFRTQLHSRLRVTEGSVLEVLNRYCYLIEGDMALRVTFLINQDGEVVWFS